MRAENNTKLVNLRETYFFKNKNVNKSKENDSPFFGLLQRESLTAWLTWNSSRVNYFREIKTKWFYSREIAKNTDNHGHLSEIFYV